MKKAVTVRIDPDLLAAARQCAQQENRSLTNLIETVLKHWIAAKATAGSQPAALRSQSPKVTVSDHD